MRRRMVISGMMGVAAAGCLRLTEGDGDPSTSDSAEDADGPDAGTGPGSADSAAITPSSIWPQFQFDGGNTGVSAGGRVRTTEPAIGWEDRSDSPSRGGIVATATHVIDRDRNGLTAYEKKSGEVAWETTETIVDEFFLNCDPVVHDDLVLFVGRNKRTWDRGVFAIGAADGEQVWQLPLTEADEYFHGLTLHGDRLYVLRRNNDSNVVAVTAVSLSEQGVEWTYEVDEYDHLNRPVAATGEIVAFGGYMEYERTGSEPEGASPGGVTVLDAADGTVRWRAEVGGTQMPVTIADGTVFATSDRSNIHHAELQADGSYPLIALDAADGTVEWRYEARNSFYNSPAVTDTCAYFGAGRTVNAVDVETGTPVWRRDLGRYVDNQSPLVVGDTVLIGDFGFEEEPCHVNALDAESGELRWSHAIDEHRLGNFLSVDAAVFLKARTFDDGNDSETLQGLWW